MSTAPMPADILGPAYRSSSTRRPVTPFDLKQCTMCGFNLPRAQFRQVARRDRPFYHPKCIACEAAVEKERDEMAAEALPLPSAKTDPLLRALRRRRKQAAFHNDSGLTGQHQAPNLTAWAAASYTEMALATLDSSVLFFEAFVEVFEERIGNNISADAREAFMSAVQARAEFKVKERGAI